MNTHAGTTIPSRRMRSGGEGKTSGKVLKLRPWVKKGENVSFLPSLFPAVKFLTTFMCSYNAVINWPEANVGV